MEVSRIRALRGPNLWTRHTSVEAIVTCQPNERAIKDLPGFEARLRARFPEIGLLQPAGHKEAVSLALVLEHATRELQAHAGCALTFSRSKLQKQLLIDI